MCTESTDLTIPLSNQQGFTLIELLLSLMLVGVAGLMLSFGVVHATRSFAQVQANQEVLGKAQLAMMRLIKEFTLITVVSTGNTQTISYTRSSTGGGTTNGTVAFVGDEIQLNGNVLSDDITAFSLAYYDTFNGGAGISYQASSQIIEVTISMLAAANISQQFQARVALRNL